MRMAQSMIFAVILLSAFAMTYRCSADGIRKATGMQVNAPVIDKN